MDKKELTELKRDRAYHAACECQYITAAANLTNEKMIARCIENAKWHRNHVEHIDSRLAAIKEAA